ncbi:MAG: MFS transporter [Verrucomicrobiae bacterium]|nr:MFS transporter [Verrucomicrobiae bacterium]MDW7981052.1 MFS transporter [Verrucomicrobiales bacterium]
MAPVHAANAAETAAGHAQAADLGRIRVKDAFTSLRHRNFRVFFLGQLVSLTGTWMQNTALSWLVYKLTGSKFLLGLVTAVGSAPMLLLSILGGSVADRYAKRDVLLCTQTCMMLVAFAFAWLVWREHITAAHVLVLSALTGVALAFDMPARQALMIEITSREDLMNAVSLNSSAVNAARIVGPALAGALMAKAGAAICFLLNGLSFIAVIAGLLLMQLPRLGRPNRHASALQHVLDGLSYVTRHARVRRLLLLFAAVGVFGWSYSVLMPAFATDVLQIDEARFGLLLGANGVGAMLGALTVAVAGARLRPRALLLGGLGLFCAMLGALSATRSYIAALVCLAIGGWGMLVYFSTTNTLIQTAVADDMRGRVMGVWTLVFGGMMPLGGLQAGTVAEHLGVRRAIALGATVCAAAALAVSRRLWQSESGRLGCGTNG